MHGVVSAVGNGNGNANGGGGGRCGKKGGGGSVNVDMGAAAARALSDTGLDVKAFGDALARIQIHANGSGRMSGRV